MLTMLENEKSDFISKPGVSSRLEQTCSSGFSKQPKTLNCLIVTVGVESKDGTLISSMLDSVIGFEVGTVVGSVIGCEVGTVVGFILRELP